MWHFCLTGMSTDFQKKVLRETIQIKFNDKSYIYIYAGNIGLIILSAR